ncbi:uncharacterized protein LOC112056571 [Bicyclus anynana]|uniref:Uncharacterized protein LOC112056571 n=1 Tax=Bicyclus anynana TaxID=110368 RepID=A0ABM3LUH2_BICAN|nr:uncharacterized protein LOC112056571 [Bicyclus anynana]
MEKLILMLLATVANVISSPLITLQELQNQQQNKAKFCSSLLHFNKYYYSPGESIAINGYPADMSVHWQTGNIYYTLINNEMKMNLQVLHSSGDFETIKVVGLGQSSTVDNLNDIVYLATDNGVYKYNDDGTTERYAALNEDVMYLTVSHDGSVMYIATWPQNRVHKITNEGQKQETFSPIPNGHGLTTDTRDNIFFIATKTSYVLKNDQTVPIKIKGLPNERMTGVFVSRSDEVFAMDDNSNLYTIDVENDSANLLGSFNVTDVNTFAMDAADNVLIGVKGRILKFNAYDRNPCEETYDS